MIDFLKRYNDSLKLKSSSQQIRIILNSRKQHLENIHNNKLSNNKLSNNNTQHINQTPSNLEKLSNNNTEHINYKKKRQYTDVNKIYKKVIYNNNGEI